MATMAAKAVGTDKALRALPGREMRDLLKKHKVKLRWQGADPGFHLVPPCSTLFHLAPPSGFRDTLSKRLYLFRRLLP
jgi:hypothetical protein